MAPELNQGLMKSIVGSRNRAYIANQTQSLVDMTLDNIDALQATNGASALSTVFSVRDGTHPENGAMERPRYIIGVDMAADTFASSVLSSPDAPVLTHEQWANTLDGFTAFTYYLQEHEATPDNAVICMEATGVYGEAFCHAMVGRGFRVAVEPPRKVKRAFTESAHKTDAVDSRQLATYGYRFYDELTYFVLPSEIQSQIRELLGVRDLCQRQCTAIQNALHAGARRPVRDPLAQQVLVLNRRTLQEQVQQIDERIRSLIDQEPRYRQLIALLDAIPGVGLLLATRILLLTWTRADAPGYRSTAAFLGMCPFQHSSGTSLRSRPRSRGHGPAHMRKLLHLAARSVATHHPQFRAYYQRKLAEGKPKRLVLNNIANKLLRIICAMLRDKAAYTPNYRSINPLFLQHA